MKLAINVNVSIFGNMLKTKTGFCVFFIECFVVFQLCKLIRVLHSSLGVE